MTFSVWILELEVKWPRLTFRRHRRKHFGHKRHSLTFHSVHEPHSVVVTFKRKGHAHGHAG